jgi:antitoxin VapB
MSETGIAKLFQNGRSQAVRLPRQFRFAGDRVRVRRVGNGVLLEPIASDVAAWFAALDQVGARSDQPFMSDGTPESRAQPVTPVRGIFD